MSEKAKYKHNFCLSFSVLSNDAPDAVGAAEIRQEIADVLKEHDEVLLLGVRLEDSEDMEPPALPTRKVEVVLRPAGAPGVYSVESEEKGLQGARVILGGSLGPGVEERNGENVRRAGKSKAESDRDN